MSDQAPTIDLQLPPLLNRGPRRARTLMIRSTASDVCKSLLVACPARVYHQMRQGMMPAILDSFERLCAEAGSSHQAQRLLPEYLRRLRVRAGQPAFHPDGPQQVLEVPAGLFGVRRDAPDNSRAPRVPISLTHSL
jgi:hypothetical protein